MSTPRVIRYTSTEELRHAAGAWDDLWHRSDATLPTSRAELIAQYVNHFAPHDCFIALAVEQDGQLVAALPLLNRRVARVLSVGSAPSNDWVWAGELLVDNSSDTAAVLAALLAEVRRLPWPLLWFDAVPLESTRWRNMLSASSAAGLGYAAKPRFVIGTVEIEDQLHRDWDAYNRLMSGNMRRQLGKAHRRAGQGNLEFEMCSSRDPGDVEANMREGFEIEHRCWKGREGSSVLANPHMERFYLGQAAQIARWGQLQLAFLRYKGQRIAFEYGWLSKRIYFSPKVGYDDAFAHLSPGQVLQEQVLQHCFASTDYHSADFCGPMLNAGSRWATHTYRISRLVIDTGRFRGRALLAAYKRLRALRGPCNRAAGEELKILDVSEFHNRPLSAVSQ